MIKWLKQFIGIRFYICTTLVQGSSKSKFVLKVVFVYLFSSLGDDSGQAPGDWLNALSLSQFTIRKLPEDMKGTWQWHSVL